MYSSWSVFPSLDEVSGAVGEGGSPHAETKDQPTLQAGSKESATARLRREARRSRRRGPAFDSCQTWPLIPSTVMGVERVDVIFKILVLGEMNTGKTSLIRRYVERKFARNYRVTLGADFNQKDFLNNETMRVRLQLWDIAGQERFGSFTRVYYKDAVAALIVFDMEHPKSLQTALKWKEDVDDKIQLSNGQPLPVILIGNKSDLIQDKPWARSLYTKAYFESFCKDHGFLTWFTTSCLDGTNVDVPFQFVGDFLLDCQIPIPEEHKDIVKLSTEENLAKHLKSNTCCNT